MYGVQGRTAGIASIAIGIIFGILMILSFIFPGPSGLSYSAVVVGAGTIVSVIVLAVALLQK